MRKENIFNVSIGLNVHRIKVIISRTQCRTLELKRFTNICVYECDKGKIC